MKKNQIGILSLMAGVVVLSLSANQAKAETSIWGSDLNLGPYTKYYDDNGNLTKIVQTVYDGQSNPTIVYSFGYYDGNTYMTEQVYSKSGMQDSSYGYLVGSNTIPISGKLIDNNNITCSNAGYCYNGGPSIQGLKTTTGQFISDIKLLARGGGYIDVYGNPWVDNNNENNNSNNTNNNHVHSGIEYSYDSFGSNTTELTTPLKIYDNNGELLAEISVDGKEVGSNGVVLDSGTVTIYDHSTYLGSNAGHGTTLEAYDLTTGKLIKKVERNNSGTLDEYTYEYADNGAYSEYLNGSLLGKFNADGSKFAKRIYTVPEATDAVKGNRNTFIIRYR